MAMLSDQSARRSTTLVQTENCWMDCRIFFFFTDIHGSERMDPTDFGDLLTFLHSTTMKLTYVVPSEISIGWIAMKFSAVIQGP